MGSLSVILMVLAMVLLFVAAFWNPQPNPPRVHLGWLGMAVWALSIVLGGLGGFHR